MFPLTLKKREFVILEWRCGVLFRGVLEFPCRYALPGWLINDCVEFISMLRYIITLILW